MIFVLLAQGLERGSYEPDVTGSIPVWDKSIFGGGKIKKKNFRLRKVPRLACILN